jgi:hypothetical protein
MSAPEKGLGTVKAVSGLFSWDQNASRTAQKPWLCEDLEPGADGAI